MGSAPAEVISMGKMSPRLRIESEEPGNSIKALERQRRRCFAREMWYNKNISGFHPAVDL